MIHRCWERAVHVASTAVSVPVGGKVGEGMDGGTDAADGDDAGGGTDGADGDGDVAGGGTPPPSETGREA